MNLNKIKNYQPYNRNTGAVIHNDPYDDAIWGADVSGGPSRKAVRDKIESMGYIGNIAIVDATYGNDATARAGNGIRPFLTHAAAMGSLPYGQPALCITMPGTYAINNSFGFPMRDLVDHLFLGATININQGGFAYGSIMIYPSFVKSRLFGEGTFNLLATNNKWAQITPYVGCDLTFEGITFKGGKQLIGEQGAFANPKQLKFIRCNCITTDNNINIANNAGNFNAFGDILASFEDCYIEGAMIISTQNSNVLSEYILKYYRCKFQGIDTNANGEKASLVIMDYYSNPDKAKILLQDCSFKSSAECIHTNSYSGEGTDKTLVIHNTRFESRSEGWIVNDNSAMGFKLLNNFSTNAATGNPVTNQLSAPGISIEPNLEAE